ncbi:MAG: heat-inducible transcriptional repressor HrcA [Acidobacteria bacterium]|nr:heat-inducible transcriptional repressor HrcA [Acidobacteriota bacterium]
MAIEALSLNERSRRILATLVREHIDSGEPVASQVLVRRGGFGLSSATIRNVLARLEKLGYVRQPHTSAGRVPTDAGYRIYVDSLLTRPRASRATASVEAQVLERIGGRPDLDTMISAVPHMLSQASHHIAFATTPSAGTAEFQRIEFVSLGAGRVFVIVVARNSQISHKVIELEGEVAAGELEQAANYLNIEFSGMSLAAVRDQVLERMSHDRVLYDRLMARALRLARSTFEGLGHQVSLFVDGTSALVDEVSAPYSGITLAALGVLVRLIEEKHRLVRLLSEYIDTPGLTVIIGAEHSDPNLRQFSLVASTYSDGRDTGSVGLIGPMRMHYAKAISMVDGAAQAVSRVLTVSSGQKTPAGS